MQDKKVNMEGFVTRLADKGYTKKDSAEIIGDFLQVIYEAVAEGYDISLFGFGSLSVMDTKPRTLRNIHDGKPMHVPSHKKIKFKPGALLKRAAEGIAP